MTPTLARSDFVPIHGLIAEAATRFPNAVAVSCGGTSSSYGDLETRANRLAHRLVQLRDGNGGIVGLFVEHSIDMVVGMLGILKAGHAYVPLDPNYPRERLDLMIADSGLSLIVTQSALVPALSSPSIKAICLDAVDEDGQATELNACVTPDDLAYVIYTSGSSGRPKGVMITHGCLADYLRDLIQFCQLAAEDSVLHVSSISFDPSVRDIFATLLAGARLVTFDTSDRFEPSHYLDIIAAESVSVLLSITPTLLAEIVRLGESRCDLLRSPRMVLTCGETLTSTLLGKASAIFANCEFVNQYGPTECTMTSSRHRVSQADMACPTIPIGKARPGVELLVLDEFLEPVSGLEIGEICIAGVGLARGYWREPSLTAVQFVPHPSAPDGERLYRTGDLGRRSASGDIEYCGRRDEQIKVRGVRIELAEVETALLSCPGVVQAAAIALQNEDDVILAADIVVSTGTKCMDVRHHLSRTAPSHLIPSEIRMVPNVPRTPSGKIDRRALRLRLTPGPEVVERTVDVVRAADRRIAIEQTVAQIWAQALRLPSVGLDDVFFDLGGNSISAMRIISRINECFEMMLPVRVLFDAPTVNGLCAAIKSSPLWAEFHDVETMHPTGTSTR